MKVNQPASNATGNLSQLDNTKMDRVQIKHQKSESPLKKLGDIQDSARVELSPQAKLFQKAKEIADPQNDFDQEKVLKLQKLIDQGKYQVPTENVADSMLREHLLMDE